MAQQYAYLSAAIRAGARLRPQGFGEIMSSDGRSCAIGAGAEALGLHIPPEESQQLLYDEVERLFSYLKVRSTCPEEGRCSQGTLTRTLTNLIWHLNDEHGLTREAIADWLYTEEEKLGFTTLLEASDELSLGVTNEESLSPEKVFA